MKKEINLTLPEWVFLDGNSHLGDTLENRVILQHVKSFTIIELYILMENAYKINPALKTKKFTYKNIADEKEKHLLVVLFSLAADYELDMIMENAIEFYKQFMDWEDASLIIEETSKDN
jgi:SRSO17 transposase